MSKIKKQYSEEFKFKVALAALQGGKTMAALCQEFSVHETQIKQWRETLRSGGSTLFNLNARGKESSKISELSRQISQLNEHIGELSVENKFLKKNLRFCL